MPDFGALSTKNHPFATPAVAPLYPAPPWTLKGAEILQISFEIDKQVSLRWLPTTLTRPNPAYAHVMVAHYPSSPVGPFSVAHQFLMSRLRVLPRSVPFQSIVDNADALPALREAWGFPAKLGTIALKREDDGVTASVERPAGNVLARLSMSHLRPMAPGDLHYDPILSLRYTPPAQPGRPPEYAQLVQVDPSYTVRESYRGKGSIIYPGASEADPWHMVQMADFICITYALCDTELPWARFLEKFE